MQKIRIFMVESPLQLMNAFEAIKYFSKPDDKVLLIVRYTRNQQAIKHLDSILKMYPTININVLKIGNVFPESYFLSFLVLLLKFIGCSENKETYIGHFKSLWMRLFSLFHSNSKFVLLDDGSANINIHKDAYDISLLNYVSQNPIKTVLVKYFKVPLLKTLFRGVKNITPFTMYDLKPYEGQSVIKNEYKLLTEMTAENGLASDTVFFIGGNLITLNIIKLSDFNFIMNKIIKSYTNERKKIVYIMHRYEKIEDLQHLEELHEGTFSIKRLDMPIELYFLSAKIKPEYIVSFVSTALFTLSNIYKPNSTISFRIPDKLIEESIRAAYSNVYTSLQNKPSIEVNKIF